MLLDIVLKSIIRKKKDSLYNILIFIVVPITFIILLSLQSHISNQILNDVMVEPIPFDYSLVSENNNNQKLIDILNYGDQIDFYNAENSLINYIYYSSTLGPNFAIINQSKSIYSVKVFFLPSYVFTNGIQYYFYSNSTISANDNISVNFKVTRSNDSYSYYNKNLVISQENIMPDDFMQSISEYFRNIENNTLILSNNFAIKYFKSQILDNKAIPIYLEYRIKSSLKLFLNYSRSELNSLSSINKIKRSVDIYEDNIIKNYPPYLKSPIISSPFKRLVEKAIVDIEIINNNIVLLSIPIWIIIFYIFFLLQDLINRPLYDFISNMKKRGMKNEQTMIIITLRFIIIDFIGLILSFIIIIALNSSDLLSFNISEILNNINISLIIIVILQFISNYRFILNENLKFIQTNNKQEYQYSFKYLKERTKLNIFMTTILILLILAVIISSNVILIIIFTNLIELLLPLLIYFLLFLITIIILTKSIRYIFNISLIQSILTKGVSKFNIMNKKVIILKDIIIFFLLFSYIFTIIISANHFQSQDQSILGFANGISNTPYNMIDNINNSKLMEFKRNSIFIDYFYIDYKINNLDQEHNISIFIIDPNSFDLLNKIISEDMTDIKTKFTSFIEKPGKAIVSNSLMNVLNLDQKISINLGNGQEISADVTKVYNRFDLFSRISSNWLIVSTLTNLPMQYIMKTVIVTDKINEDELIKFHRLTNIKMETENDIPTKLSANFRTFQIFNSVINIIILIQLVIYTTIYFLLLFYYHKYFSKMILLWKIRGGEANQHNKIHTHFLTWFIIPNKRSIPILSTLLAMYLFIVISVNLSINTIIFTIDKFKYIPFYLIIVKLVSFKIMEGKTI